MEQEPAHHLVGAHVHGCGLYTRRPRPPVAAVTEHDHPTVDTHVDNAGAITGCRGPDLRARAIRASMILSLMANSFILAVGWC